MATSLAVVAFLVAVLLLACNPPQVTAKIPPSPAPEVPCLPANRPNFRSIPWTSAVQPKYTFNPGNGTGTRVFFRGDTAQRVTPAVWQLVDEAAFAACNFTGAELLTNLTFVATPPAPFTNFVFPSPGPFTYYLAARQIDAGGRTLCQRESIKTALVILNEAPFCNDTVQPPAVGPTPPPAPMPSPASPVPPATSICYTDFGCQTCDSSDGSSSTNCTVRWVAIALIIVAILLLIGGIVACVIFFMRRKKNTEDDDDEEEEYDDEDEEEYDEKGSDDEARSRNNDDDEEEEEEDDDDDRRKKY